MKQKPGFLQKKFMVPTSAMGIGLGNQVFDAGLPPWLVVTMIAASVGYALIEGWVDVSRMKYGYAAKAAEPSAQPKV